MSDLYLEHELAFHTQYAELKERTLAAGALLPGTPGSLKNAPTLDKHTGIACSTPRLAKFRNN